MLDCSRRNLGNTAAQERISMMQELGLIDKLPCMYARRKSQPFILVI